MHELEPRFDQVGFFIAAEVARVLEDSPCERAVAPTLESELVQSSHERGAVFGVDPVLDLDQDRATIVIDLLAGLRQAPMLGGRKVKRGPLLQLPSPGEGNRRNRASSGDEKRGRKSGSRGDLAPRRAAQGHRPIDDGQKHGEAAAAHPIRQDILCGGVKAGQVVDPRDSGEQAGAKRNREVLRDGEQRQRERGQDRPGSDQPVGAELAAQFLMSKRSEDRSDADRAEQEPVVLRALAGSPGDQRQEAPVRRGERIDRNGPRQRRP